MCEINWQLMQMYGERDPGDEDTLTQGTCVITQDKRKGGGGYLAGTQSVKLYLGAWCK